MILDGAGLATNAATVGNDSRLNNTLIGIHDYTMFVSPPYTSETQWANHLAGEIGGFANRTVVTEWGAPMSPGSKNGVHYDTIDYNVPGTNYFDDYVRGESSEMRTLGVGSVYWPGLRDGDWYSLTTRTGSGAGIALALTNASGLARLQYAWGTGGGGGGSYVQLRNAATGLCVDGAGATTNGADRRTVLLRQWQRKPAVDGRDRRKPGAHPEPCDRPVPRRHGQHHQRSAVGQWSDSNSGNQQWTISANGATVRIVNSATGLYVDGMGRPPAVPRSVSGAVPPAQTSNGA